MRSTVNVMKGKEQAYYSGLICCGSVWICPVCSFKISEGRRQELVHSVEAWRRRGGSVLMVTWTAPHYEFQPLSERLTAFSKARKLMMHRKPYKALKERIGLVGTIRALEVTYGENGWHVHVHELLFLAPGCPLGHRELTFQFLPMWQSACQAAGVGLPNTRGVQVDDGSQAAQYASKWGIEAEMTKSHVKEGRKDSMTPWDFIRRGEKELFLEYGKAFKGRRQLVWSEGLRKILGLGEMQTDEELAGQEEEESLLLGELDRFQWETILRADRRGELLYVAEMKGWSGVLEYIAELIRADGSPSQRGVHE